MFHPISRSPQLPKSATTARRLTSALTGATLVVTSVLVAGPAVAQDVVRVGAADRVGTALAIYENNAETFSSSTVVLVRGDDFADALTATPLAAAFDAPVIPVMPGPAEQRTLAALARHEVSTVVIVGGENAVSASLAAQLGAGRTVQRIHGESRYDTAEQVAHRVRELHGGGATPVFLASGTDFADALTAGTVASHRRGVVLLTEGSHLPSATRQYLRYPHAGERLAVGGPAAAAMATAGVTGESVVGADRYETAALLNAKVYGSKAAQAATVLVSGERFGDTLSAAALAAGKGIPLTLTASNSLPAATGAFLRAEQPSVTVVGGPSAVSHAVAAECAALTGGQLLTTDGALRVPVNDRGEPIPAEVAAAIAKERGTTAPVVTDGDIVLTDGVRGDAWSDLGIKDTDDFVETITHIDAAGFAWMAVPRARYEVEKEGDSFTLTAVPSRVKDVTFTWREASSKDALATAPGVLATPGSDDRLTRTVAVGAAPTWVSLTATPAGKDPVVWGPVHIGARERVDHKAAVTPVFTSTSRDYRLWTSLAHKPYPVRSSITDPRTGRPLTPADGQVQFLVDCLESCTQGEHVYGRVVTGKYNANTQTWEGAFVARIATDFAVQAFFVSNDPSRVRSAISAPVTHSVKWLTADYTKRLRDVRVDQAGATPSSVRADETVALSARVTREHTDGSREPVRSGSVVFYAGNYRLCTADRTSATADGVWRCRATLGTWANGMELHAKYIEPFEKSDPATAPGVEFDTAEAVYDFPSRRPTFTVTP